MKTDSQLQHASSKAHLSDEQRLALGRQLQSRLTAMERQSASQLTGLSQAGSARQTLLQDTDDATQRAGIHEVEATVSNIENQMPGSPFEGGFGLLSIHGIAKPVYRAFELLHRLGRRRLVVDGQHDTVSAWVVADDGTARATLLLANHALPRHRIRTETVRFELRDAPAPLGASVERIDDLHANAPRAWRRMGRPDDLNAQQLEQLHEASRLRAERIDTSHADGVTVLELELPPHAVAAVTLELAPDAQ